MMSTAPQTDGYFAAPPTVGMKYRVYGKLGTIVRVHPFGTIDVEMPNGNRYRVTGLSFK